MTLVVGPLLREVFKAQANDDAVLRHTQIGSYAKALIDVCQDLNYPLVWPVGAAAERLAGAATMLADGQIQVWDRHSTVDGNPVLLVALNLVGSLVIETEMKAARGAGANRVYVCAVSVPGLENVSGLDQCVTLSPTEPIGAPLDLFRRRAYLRLVPKPTR